MTIQLPGKEFPVRQGGLFSCCTKAISKTEKMMGVGDSIECPQCHDRVMIGPDGQWRWGGKTNGVS
jgi:hypothetical protein